MLPKYLPVLLLLSFLSSVACADEPPAWVGFSVTSPNGEYTATVARGGNGWTLEVSMSGGGAALWSAEYIYDGYAGGALSDDGSAFAYVSFWYYDDSPVITVYRKGGGTFEITGAELGLDPAMMKKTASHTVWLSDTRPAYKFVTARDGGLWLEVNTLDGARLVISVGEAGETGNVSDSDGGLSISLRPEKESYSQKDAHSGSVVLIAGFTNNTDKPVYVAHPAATVPDGYEPGTTFSMDERHGKSEILLYVTDPDGDVSVFRNNALRGFEPGNVFRLDIQPGETREIRLGWLGPYFSLGMWEDLREPLFTERGEHTVRIVFRNHFGRAFKFDRGGDVFEKDAPWKGELESGETAVRVE